MGTSSHTPWRLGTSWASNTLVDGFVEEVTACMDSKVTIMNLLHHLLQFVQSETPQISIEMEFGVGLLIQDIS